jgi:dipeptidyl aminopeptidase/acylaminoacyl peptidase
MLASRMRHAALGIVAAIAVVFITATPAAAQRRSDGGSGVYKARLAPHWFAGGDRFWYRNDLSRGRREFIVVDAELGRRERAFDHQKLADALAAAGFKDVAADKLPIDALSFQPGENAIVLRTGERTWRYEPTTDRLTELTGEPAEKELSAAAPAASPTSARRSRTTGAETELTFVNKTSGDIEIFWLDTDGQRRSYGRLAAGASKPQHTFAGHAWEVVAADGRALGTFVAEESGATVSIDGNPLAAPIGQPMSSTNSRARGQRSGQSPDRRWTAAIKDHNLVLRAAEGEEEIQLTRDGREGLAYGMLQWSPDSEVLAAFRIQPAERKLVHLVESSPRGGGRAVLHSRSYSLPGDEMTRYELCLFDVGNRAAIDCQVDAIDFGTPRVRFSRDGKKLTYEQIDRGHQRLRLIEVDTETGASRNLIDERSNTFIWTAHTENAGLPRFTWLDSTDEIIYASERDGWRHLYLINARDSAIKQQVTKGEYVVRGIDRIDEQGRQIWFRASGRQADQDPYFIHHYRVNFDGSGLVELTAGNGNHTVQFSPDSRYLIDTWSRVDQPAVHELRRTSDGQLVCKLEEADAEELLATGWQAPEVLTAKGRDGKTDIWGILCRPRDFDPSKKYPVIEQIYAGPQGSYVPKSFSPQRRFASLTDSGFVVVQIDGMGTANRSKAFHDVCWKNLKDAGLADRILWHEAAAAKYPWYDISRVGIYGTSAGGQNSTAALLFHPEFYKVGVSACGCHDNRLDKASWNEQWMGYPVGPEYAESSNIDNAARLQGKLLLIVGETDTNVPPESTLRLADALIRADKDFDLLVVPGAGHGMGGSYGQRRMRDFFVRHLLGGAE